MLYSLCNQASIWGGIEQLNKYFLKGRVSEKLPQQKFYEEVLKECNKIKPELYYCHQPTIIELYLKEMQDVKPEEYDKQIIRIIRKHADLKKRNSVNQIVSQTIQLPFVVDALWDGCYEKNLIYPTYFHLMVKMNISGKIVERDYYIKGAKFRYIGLRLGPYCSIGRYMETKENTLDFKSCGYSPGAIDAARKYCEEVKTQRNKN